MFGLIETVRDLFSSNPENDDFNKYEEDIKSLQKKYLEALDEYYRRKPPLKNIIEEVQQINWYIRLVRHSLYSGSTDLLQYWGIDYAQDKLVKPKNYYRDRFNWLSEPEHCLEMGLPTGMAFYFNYLYSHFPEY